MFSYRWKLSETKFSKDKGTVFSCFAGGGGSSLGYKLAGFDVLGFCEIDSRIAKTYLLNQEVKYPFVCSIKELVSKSINRELPNELYNLDILDGSPPCSSFSTLGNREKDWGKEKKFAEGQVKQVLDTLFFDFIKLASVLNPKIVIAENVTGLLKGRAKHEYFDKILKGFDDIGYNVQCKVVNAYDCGVPQNRNRVIIIAVRKDLKNFEIEIPEVYEKFVSNDVLNFKENRRSIVEYYKESWLYRNKSDRTFADSRVRAGLKYSNFATVYVHKENPFPTITSFGLNKMILFDEPFHPSKEEIILASSFPIDYKFIGKNYNFILGMSVPPVMMAHIAKSVYDSGVLTSN